MKHGCISNGSSLSNILTSFPMNRDYSDYRRTSSSFQFLFEDLYYIVLIIPESGHQLQYILFFLSFVHVFWLFSRRQYHWVSTISPPWAPNGTTGFVIMGIYKVTPPMPPKTPRNKAFLGGVMNLWTMIRSFWALGGIGGGVIPKFPSQVEKRRSTTMVKQPQSTEGTRRAISMEGEQMNIKNSNRGSVGR